MCARTLVAMLLLAGFCDCRSGTRACYPDERCVRPISPPPPGCENGPSCYADVVRCHEYGDDTDCPGDYSCVYTGWTCRGAPHDQGVAVDLASQECMEDGTPCDAGVATSDGAASDDAGCPAGQRSCGMSCIPVSACCIDQDCPGPLQSCEVDAGTCQCPVQMKPCGRDCISRNKCCSDADCPATPCVAGVCQAPSCGDRLKNGQETDVDCGGPNCPACKKGQRCVKNGDCENGPCNGGVCG